jgi:CopG antitoxin of type II toxin-antitoxin system
VPEPTGKTYKKRSFRSLEEEAEFWDTHSPLDFPDEWGPFKLVSGRRPLGHILAVRLDAKTLGRLASRAREQGIGPSTLARMWILERLGPEEAMKEHTPAAAGAQ